MVGQISNHEIRLDELIDDGRLDDVTSAGLCCLDRETRLVRSRGDECFENFVEEALWTVTWRLFAEGHDDESGPVKLPLRLPYDLDVPWVFWRLLLLDVNVFAEPFLNFQALAVGFENFCGFAVELTSKVEIGFQCVPKKFFFRKLGAAVMLVDAFEEVYPKKSIDLLLTPGGLIRRKRDGSTKVREFDFLRVPSSDG